MSSTSAHKQAHADVGSETCPPMLERLSSYQKKVIPATTTQPERPQTEDDFTSDDLKHYEADMKAMNLILMSIPKNIYNFVDASENARDMWNRTKRLMQAKTHDPLALVVNTYASCSSSRSPAPYYVTHTPSMVDYKDDYQGDSVCDDQEDSLTKVIMLLVVQADRVNIQRRNVGNGGRFARRSLNTYEEFAESNNVQKETRNDNIQRTLRTSSSGNVANVQCYNFNAKGHYT
ncbi:hypothetical protein Tco_0809566 [Tanacetum coccineum]